jgi:hypothetical protein
LPDNFTIAYRFLEKLTGMFKVRIKSDGILYPDQRDPDIKLYNPGSAPMGGITRPEAVSPFYKDAACCHR